MATYKGKNYTFVPALSFAGDVPTGGFESEFVQCAGYATMLVAYYGDFGSTLNIYESNVRDTTGRIKIFTKTLSANSKFLKRFQLSSTFIQIEIVNDAEEADKKLYLDGSFSATTQFQTQKLLNSKIDIDDNLEIKKVVNDYYDDVIRGGYDEIQKVNVSGVLESQPTLTEVVGLTDDYNYTDTTTIANIVVSNANDNSTGIGARQVLVEGVKGDGTTFSETIDLVTGTSSTGIAMMAVNRMEVISTGTSRTNLGTIQITGSNGDILSHIGALRNIANDAYYKVPSGKQLVVRDIHLSGFAQGGKLNVLLFEPDTGQNKSLGKFSVDISNTQINYPLNKKISALDVIKVTYTPPPTSGEILINVNINGILYPTPNTF